MVHIGDSGLGVTPGEGGRYLGIPRKRVVEGEITDFDDRQLNSERLTDRMYGSRKLRGTVMRNVRLSSWSTRPSM